MLQSYHHSVGWPDDLTCHECHSTDHTVDHFFNCPTHPTGLALRDMWVATLQVVQFLAGLPQLSDLPPLQINFDSFLPNPDVGRLQRVHIIFISPFTPYHFTLGPEVISPLPLSNNSMMVGLQMTGLYSLRGAARLG